MSSGTAGTAPADLSAYWSTVAQLCPVLALGLILELRRRAQRPRDRVQRFVDPLAVLCAILSLVGTFVVALYVLATGKAVTSPESSVWSLAYVLVVLTVRPALSLLGAGASPIVAVAARLLPFTPRARQHRELQRLQRRLERLMLDSLDSLEGFEARIARVRASVDEMHKHSGLSDSDLGRIRREVDSIEADLPEGEDLLADIVEQFVQVEDLRRRTSATHFSEEDRAEFDRLWREAADMEGRLNDEQKD
ncbi:hypothetical protein QDR37_00385 [Amnibacterium sp. CER49]|uniref:hypothetical protein n=1 Tax=Amnibacterium sp. CER49 TaxID=3039161 RepID=UPI00244CDCF8|nr:hypothetical protein [Amnibacterium sp. CER49]MDH2442394.1 hypothetical protein [Amnibacterium sp. CER49]